MSFLKCPKFFDMGPQNILWTVVVLKNFIQIWREKYYDYKYLEKFHNVCDYCNDEITHGTSTCYNCYKLLNNQDNDY